MPITSTNPATGETLEVFAEFDNEEIERCLSRAATAFSLGMNTSFVERSRWMERAANILEDEVDEVATMMTTEMGKTITAARQEVLKCATACRYFAQHAAEFLETEPYEPRAVGATRAQVRYRPLGVILAIMPWNFPLWQAIRFAAPALMAGNIGLLKHASNVPRSALFLEQLFHRAGFPPGFFQTLLIGSDKIPPLLQDSRVAAVTLTGSTAAGRAVATIAGSVAKKSVLELGGSDPFIVMASADPIEAAKRGAAARCLNNGQSCIAAKRFIVHRAIAAPFMEAFVSEMSSFEVGDPMAIETAIGPLATEPQRTEIAELVEDARSKGGIIHCGGFVPNEPGWFYPPTVISNVTDDMRVHNEEVFGPVATIYEIDTIEEAVALANGTDFGLGANVWTDDELEQMRFIEEIDAGMVFVNGNVTSYPELPFGGIKGSGYGRELSAHGIREFCNTKTVWVR